MATNVTRDGKEWRAWTAHDKCAECGECTQKAITMATVTGSREASEHDGNGHNARVQRVTRPDIDPSTITAVRTWTKGRVPKPNVHVHGLARDGYIKHIGGGRAALPYVIVYQRSSGDWSVLGMRQDPSKGEGNNWHAIPVTEEGVPEYGDGKTYEGECLCHGVNVRGAVAKARPKPYNASEDPFGGGKLVRCVFLFGDTGAHDVRLESLRVVEQ